MFLLLRFCITLLVLLFIAHVIPGITIDQRYEIVSFAIILSLISAFIRPLIILLTLPITIITLGLFTLVIDIFIFWLGAILSYGVHVQTFTALVIAGCVVWVTGIITNLYIWRQGE